MLNVTTYPFEIHFAYSVASLAIRHGTSAPLPFSSYHLSPFPFTCVKYPPKEYPLRVGGVIFGSKSSNVAFTEVEPATDALCPSSVIVYCLANHVAKSERSSATAPPSGMVTPLPKLLVLQSWKEYPVRVNLFMGNAAEFVNVKFSILPDTPFAFASNFTVYTQSVCTH